MVTAFYVLLLANIAVQGCICVSASEFGSKQQHSQQLNLQHSHHQPHLQQQSLTAASQVLETAHQFITARVSRSLLQAASPPNWKPSRDEKDRAKSAGHFSASHAIVVLLMCVAAMILLGYSGYKAMKWLERIRRPGYVELQSLDSAYHRPLGL